MYILLNRINHGHKWLLQDSYTKFPEILLSLFIKLSELA